jgi:hypothetical protein
MKSAAPAIAIRVGGAAKVTLRPSASVTSMGPVLKLAPPIAALDTMPEALELVRAMLEAGIELGAEQAPTTNTRTATSVIDRRFIWRPLSSCTDDLRTDLREPQVGRA